MRTLFCTAMTLALTVAGLGQRPCAAAPQDDLQGRWKLVVLAYGEDTFLILDIKPAPEQGNINAEVVDAQAFLANPTVSRLERTAETVTLKVKGAGTEDTFVGTAAPGEAGKVRAVLGTFRFRDTVYPARLERTEEPKAGRMQGSGPILQKTTTAQRNPDLKARVAALKDVLPEAAGNPSAYHAYVALLQAAEGAGLPEAEVRGLVEQWLTEAKPYGPAWIAEARTNALKALTGKKTYAPLTLELAQEAETGLGASATLEQKAAVAKILADAAKATGREDLAAAAAERSRTLEEQLDAEYRRKVPPFQPEPFAGRPDGKGDRVVLLELFTGAQCPPCVAADVAFDALIHSYRPSELVTLQYHLHIPGPDPLTNPAAIARQSYYGQEIGGTPTTLLNGRKDAGGGGPMALAEAKYNQYRKAIDPRLGEPATASIDLKARRSGDEIRISASAEARPAAEAKDEAKGDAPSTSSKLRLRLALIEEEVRYVGGNRLRFHHHVVRALPGGPEGKELAGGKGQVDLTVNLANVRKAIEEYLSDFAKGRNFPNPLPEVALKDLSVVAFVQDDGDKTVLHAVAVPIEPEK